MSGIPVDDTTEAVQLMELSNGLLLSPRTEDHAQRVDDVGGRGGGRMQRMRAMQERVGALMSAPARPRPPAGKRWPRGGQGRSRKPLALFREMGRVRCVYRSSAVVAGNTKGAAGGNAKVGRRVQQSQQQGQQGQRQQGQQQPQGGKKGAKKGVPRVGARGAAVERKKAAPRNGANGARA